MPPCTLDFAKGSSSHIDDDVVQGTDGTLVAEFRLAERLHRENVASNTYDTTFCAASQSKSFYQCADLAAAGTISEDEASLWSTAAEDVFYGDLSGYLDPSNAQPFGVPCDGERLGDGVVNTFDIAVFAWAMFSRAPYNVALTTQTVSTRSDLSAQCGTSSRAEWQTTLSGSVCPSGAGRRRLSSATVPFHLPHRPHRPHRPQHRLLSGATSAGSVFVSEYARIERGGDEGSWYRISVEGIQFVTELMLDGVWAADAVSLVNEPYPRRAEPATHMPADLRKMELRWARRLEFLDRDTSSCASIVNGVSGTQALVGDTLSVRQEAGKSGLMCAFEVFLYVPDSTTVAAAAAARRLDVDVDAGRAVGVRAGSTWRHPGESTILKTSVAAVLDDDYFVVDGNGTTTASPSPPPPDSSSSSPDWTLFVMAVVGGLLVAILLCCCCYYWFFFGAPPPRKRSGQSAAKDTKAPPGELFPLLKLAPLP